MAETFDDILSDKEQEKPEAVEVETQEPEKVESEPVEKLQSRRKAHQAKEFAAQGRDPDTGQFVQKEEAKPEPEKKEEAKVEVKPEPKQEFTEKEKAFLKNAQEERQKRQELERRLAELEKAKPKEEGEKKTFWDDPEGNLQHVQNEIQQVALQTKLHVAETIARSKYQDFDEKIEAFAKVLQQTPGLHAQWLASPDPAEFAYKLGKNHKELEDAGDLEKWREKIRQEERQRLEAEFKKKQEELEKQRAALPSSLSDVKGASKQNAPVWNGPIPMEDILKP